MGFQGSLDSVNLGDILQTLAMNRQTGSLVVNHNGATRAIWFDQGNIAMADGADSDGSPVLLQILIQRNLLTPDQAADIESRMYESNQHLRELLLDNALTSAQELDDMAAACLEDRVCEIFEWSTGNFEFVDGDPVAELQRLEVIDSGDSCLATQSVVMEAMRRRDEWERIREVITDPKELFIADSEGRANLKNLGEEHDPDVLKVLRLLDGRHSIDDISALAGVPRFDTFAIVSQLILGGVARPRAPQEVVDDALALRAAGETAKAADLLAIAAAQTKSPEVLRPLAELRLELGDTPTAVDLYLELIQRSQDDGDLEQALADLRVVIDINPDDPDLRIDRAECLVDVGRDDEAASEFIEAASGFLLTRDTQQAVRACHRAKDLSPTAPEPHALLAKAHLLEGQADSAMVEYRSLWHTLLSHHRPRKALDELNAILDRDCKFPQVKDQILEHARGSEAVKTSSAVRLLVYLVILLILAGGGFYGYTIYENEIAHKKRETAVKALQNRVLDADGKTDFDEIHTSLGELHAANSNEELARLIDSVRQEYTQKYESVAAQLRQRYDQEIANGELEAADYTLDQLRTRFENSPAAVDVEKLQTELADQRSEHSIADALATIDEQWQQYQWDQAATGLAGLLDDKKLTNSVKERLSAQLNQYRADLGSAEFLFRKGEELERIGRTGDAIGVFQRALIGENDFFRDEARKKLIAAEETLVDQKLSNLQTAIAQQDPSQVFLLLDEITSITTDARGNKPKEALGRLTLPITLTIDHHAVEITTVTATGEKRSFNAPKGHSGAWALELSYPATGTIALHAERIGFRPHDITISAQLRKLTESVQLERWHSWASDLRSPLAAVPVIAGSYLLAVTKDSRFHILDSKAGSGSAISFDPLHSFLHAPFVPRENPQIAYLALGGQIHVVDIGTRSRSSWPKEADAIDAPTMGRFGVWAWEGLLGNAGQFQVFAGSMPPGGMESGELVTLAIDGNQTAPFPPTKLPTAVSGPPVGHRESGLVFVPAGQYLRAYDSTSASLTSPMEQTFSYQISNQIVLRPVMANVLGKPAVLIADDAGQVIAIDANPATDNQERRLFAWSLSSAASASPVVDPNGRTAYVPLSGGGVTALALDTPTSGATRWHFPGEGQIGNLTGTCAVGDLGVYAADSNGILHCVDRDQGSLRWQVDLQSAAVSGVACSGGRIYVGTLGGSLMCFEEGEP